MRLKYDFEIVDMGNEFISVPVGESSRNLHGVIKLNKEGVEIFKLLQTDISEVSIVDILSAKYENDRESIANYVHKTIENLRINDIIEE